MAGIKSKKAMSIAVVGSGYWGKNLVRNFHELSVLKLICDKNENIVMQFKQQYTDVETCLDLEEVIDHKDIKAVVVATPTETHFTVSHKALSAGKHVFVEKPLSLTEEEGHADVESGFRNILDAYCVAGSL